MRLESVAFVHLKKQSAVRKKDLMAVNDSALPYICSLFFFVLFLLEKNCPAYQVIGSNW